jgi:DNA uptake protein ComE-like DNA-binding protein
MNPKIDHGPTGFLLLLLSLLVIYFLKPALTPLMPSKSADEGQLFIQVGGEVKSPAVYAFKSPPDLTRLINRAGGLCYDRDLPNQFQDLTLSSGMVVTVHLEEKQALVHQSGSLPRAASERAWVVNVKEMSAFYKITLGIPISLNSESEMGLTAIPGIGPGLAKAIVEERTKRNGFKSLGELLSIDGIGGKLHRKIAPYLTLDRCEKEIHPMDT